MEGASGPISENMNTDTHLLSKKATGIILKLRKHWNLEKIINSVYELSSTAQVIRWYHAAAGYPSPGSKQLRQNSLQLGQCLQQVQIANTILYQMPRQKDICIVSKQVYIQHKRKKTKSPKSKGLQQILYISEANIAITMPSSRTHQDQTSHFPIVSCQGHKYIMCLAKLDDSYMAFDLMRSHDKAGMIPVNDQLIDRLWKQDRKHKKQMLDNKTSKKYLETIKEKCIKWELVPANNHSKNLADKVFKQWRFVYCPHIGVWHYFSSMEMALPSTTNGVATIQCTTKNFSMGIHDYKKCHLHCLYVKHNVSLDQREELCLAQILWTHGTLAYRQITTDATRFCQRNIFGTLLWHSLFQASGTKDHNPHHQNGGSNCKCST